MQHNRTDENAYVFSRHRFLATIQNEQVSVVATIRQPFENDEQQWLCAASICGLFHRKKDLLGTTAEEAIERARQFLVQEFQQFITAGGRLFLSDQTPLTEVDNVLKVDR